MPCSNAVRTNRFHRSPLLLLSAYCLVLSAGNGCAYAPLRGEAPAPQPLPQEVAAYYTYPQKPAGGTVQLIRETRTVRESLVQFPLSASGFEPTEPVVEFEWFESTQPGRRAAILFNPILGGDYPLERGICRFLGESFDERMLRYHENDALVPHDQAQKHHRLLAQPPTTSRMYRWKHRMEASDVRLFERIAGPTLLKYGYSVDLALRPAAYSKLAIQRLRQRLKDAAVDWWERLTR